MLAMNEKATRRPPHKESREDAFARGHQEVRKTSRNDWLTKGLSKFGLFAETSAIDRHQLQKILNVRSIPRNASSREFLSRIDLGSG